MGNEYPKIKEDETVIVFTYEHAKDQFDLVYNKNKDLVLLLKNGKPANHKVMRSDETERYKEMLEIAICYHHDRDGEYLN